jgi:DNA-binding response OmpR family regulator
MHQGRLQATSAGPGKGCEFTIHLPLTPTTDLPESKTVIESSKLTARSVRVLVVEDDVDSGDTLSLLLRLHGHEVQLARTGPTALEMALALQPEIVLLDIGLPGMDGYQVARQMRERPEMSGTTFCALTGHTPSEADRQRQQETGFDHYFVKPVSLTRLLELLKTIGSHSI